MKRKIRFLIATLACSYGLVTHASQVPKSVPVTFGRQWFTSASGQEIRGFLVGYDDCLPNPAERMLPGWYLPTETLIHKIASYYDLHAHSNLDVGTVALKVAASTPKPPRSGGGEVYKNRHGYYDGLWWQTPNLERLGYVEGYLTCLGQPSSRNHSQGLVAAITSWYNKHPSKEDRPIASVLTEFLKAHNKAPHAP